MITFVKNYQSLEMTMPTRTDQDLIESLRKSGEKREHAWRYIYTSWRDTMFNKVLSHNGTKHEAIEALDTCCIAFERTITKEGFIIEKSLQDYLATCIFNAWLVSKKRAQIDEYQALEEKQDLPFNINNLDPETNKIIDLIITTATDDTCKIILRMYSEGYSMKEIGESINKTAKTTKNYHCNCKKRLQQWLVDNPKSANFFKSLFDNE